MKFNVYGPYKLLLKGKVLQPKDVRDAQKDFVEQTSQDTDKSNKPVSEACGCYVFAIRAGKGVRPWYVGKTEQMTFSKRCFHRDNIIKFNGLLSKQYGTPLLYLLPQMQPNNDKFVGSPNGDAIEFLETMLIGIGLQRNPDLVNIGKTNKARKLEIVGVMNTGRRASSGSAKELREVVFKNIVWP